MESDNQLDNCYFNIYKVGGDRSHGTRAQKMLTGSTSVTIRSLHSESRVVRSRLSVQAGSGGIINTV